MHFGQSFGVSKFLTDRENGSKKILPDGNLALKLLTGREFGSQNRLPYGNLALKGITGREFGSQNHLPDENLAMTREKFVFLFFIANCQIFHQ